MGMFKFEFTGVGGHGCQREAKEGQEFVGCGRMGCPDCECKRFVERMRGMLGSPGTGATLTHWPGTESQVVDDLGSTSYRSKRIENDFFNSKNKPAG